MKIVVMHGIVECDIGGDLGDVMQKDLVDEKTVGCGVQGKTWYVSPLW